MNSLKNKITNKKTNKNIKKVAIKTYLEITWTGVKFFGKPILSWMKSNPGKTALGTYVLSDEKRRGAVKKLIDPIIGESSVSSAEKEIDSDKMENFANYVLREYETKWKEETEDFADSEFYLTKMLQYSAKEGSGEDGESILNQISQEFISKINDMRSSFFNSLDPNTQSWYESSGFNFTNEEEVEASRIVTEIRTQTANCLDPSNLSDSLKKYSSDSGHGDPVGLLKKHPEAIDYQNSTAKARSVEDPGESYKEKRKRIFERFELSPSDESEKFDDLLNERFEPTLSRKPSFLMNFIREFEARLDAAGVFEKYTKLKIFNMTGESARYESGRHGAYARLETLLSFISYDYENLGTDSDQRILILNLVKKESSNKKIKNVCSSFSKEIKSKENKVIDHINYLKPNSLARLSNNIIKVAYMPPNTWETLAEESAAALIRIFKDEGTKEDYDLIEARKKAYKPWDSSSSDSDNPDLGSDGGHLIGWYNGAEKVDAWNYFIFTGNKKQKIESHKADIDAFIDQVAPGLGLDLKDSGIIRFGSFMKFFLGVSSYQDVKKQEGSGNRIIESGQTSSVMLNVLNTLQKVIGEWKAIPNNNNLQAPIRLNYSNAQGRSEPIKEEEVVVEEEENEGGTQTTPAFSSSVQLEEPTAMLEKARVALAAMSGISNVTILDTFINSQKAYETTIDNLNKSKEDSGTGAPVIEDVVGLNISHSLIEDSQYIRVGDSSMGDVHYYIQNKAIDPATIYAIGMLGCTINNKKEVVTVFATNAVRQSQYNQDELSLSYMSGGRSVSFGKYTGTQSFFIRTNFDRKYKTFFRLLGVNDTITYSTSENLTKKNGGRLVEPDEKTAYIISYISTYATERLQDFTLSHIGVMNLLHIDLNIKKTKIDILKKSTVQFDGGKGKSVRGSDMLRTPGVGFEFNPIGLAKYNAKYDKKSGLIEFKGTTVGLREAISQLGVSARYINPYVIKATYEGLGAGKSIEGRERSFKLYCEAVRDACFYELNKEGLLKLTYNKNSVLIRKDLAWYYEWAEDYFTKRMSK